MQLNKRRDTHTKYNSTTVSIRYPFFNLLSDTLNGNIANIIHHYKPSSSGEPGLDTRLDPKQESSHLFLDLIPYLIPDLILDLIPDLIIDLIVYLSPDLIPDLIIQLNRDLIKDLIPDLIQDFIQNRSHKENPDLRPDL